MERIASLAQKAERSDGAPVRRAMHNLMIAVRGGLKRKGPMPRPCSTSRP
ncbi:hypothetical protein EBBID32_40730 [Sphingobium indicum BiD32]|uniref:Uncharacterized protein n=1 Tax=Sphingobium indicum BiD32 TaxID=1301087 RepID=N1MWS4_9SPHN|nr:hypothetical protein EBBID32_40730 [Sphingobium indicum BiD32]